MAKGYFVELARVIDSSMGLVDHKSRIGGQYGNRHYILRATDGFDEEAVKLMQQDSLNYLDLLEGKIVVPFIAAIVNQKFSVRDMVGWIEPANYNPRLSDGLHLITPENVNVDLDFKDKKHADAVALALNDLSKYKRKY